MVVVKQGMVADDSQKFHDGHRVFGKQAGEPEALPNFVSDRQGNEGMGHIGQMTPLSDGLLESFRSLSDVMQGGNRRQRFFGVRHPQAPSAAEKREPCLLRHHLEHPKDILGVACQRLETDRAVNFHPLP
jgi:hypothetical protein